MLASYISRLLGYRASQTNPGEPETAKRKGGNRATQSLWINLLPLTRLPVLRTAYLLAMLRPRYNASHNDSNPGAST